MLLLTIEVTDRHAMKTLHSLEEKHLIRINKNADLNSPSLPGNPLSIKAFRNWVSGVETLPTISLNDAKTRWAGKRKRLEKLTK